MQWATKHWRRFSALRIFSVLLISPLLLLLISPPPLVLLLHLIICGLCSAGAWAPAHSAGMCCSGTICKACQWNKCSIGIRIQSQRMAHGTAGPAQIFGMIGRTLACHGSSTLLLDTRAQLQYALRAHIGEQRLSVPGINEETTCTGLPHTRAGAHWGTIFTDFCWSGMGSCCIGVL